MAEDAANFDQLLSQLGQLRAPLEPSAATTATAPVANWETAHHNLGGLRIPGSTVGPLAGGFQQFATEADGVAAISHQLDRYASGATTGQPLNTLRQIVSTWAPPNENDTPALIARASRVTGFAPDQPLNVGEPAVKAKLIEAMIRNEQGGTLPIDPAIIAHVASLPPGQIAQHVASRQAAPTSQSSTTQTGGEPVPSTSYPPPGQQQDWQTLISLLKQQQPPVPPPTTAAPTAASEASQTAALPYLKVPMPGDQAGAYKSAIQAILSRQSANPFARG